MPNVFIKDSTMQGIADAIREKSGTADPLYPEDMPPTIRAIPSGGGGGWQPHPDWWDIETMVNTGVLEWSGEHIDNVRYGFVVSDGYATTKLAAGYEYYLSDGTYYPGTATVTHEWDRSKDKPCAEGYMTRAVVVSSMSPNVIITQRGLTLDGIVSLYVYLGDCHVLVLSAGNSTVANANRGIQAIVCNDSTTAGSNAIAASAFQGCYSLATITIPQGVTSIGTNAFSSCIILDGITIPQGVTSIGNNAFSSCSTLTGITIPQGVTSIGSLTFTFCRSLASITIPQGVTSVGANAFTSCSALASITISQDVTSISANAFTDCSALANVTIPIGFNLSLSLSTSTLLSVTSLENLITNAADMTGQTAITFTLGATNLAKLSDEIKALAASKNITLA